ncbi:hypothetical protein [Alkalilimnicola sp. S0819]|uniref:hypothetical protein n=1 Tax=Alkalilimnicola sp. S0819 TaxID=2613922 RepID=UPI0012623E0F|nr:hypothetical protein [Alkalilimnicola sp. S0819]KAB7624395.1 hypothetical protein F3N43_06195 [Alkalilimnicola sp. S0819]MPQ16222.1 hypothetical protein [Alkalilimnicola sp. S0819]
MRKFTSLLLAASTWGLAQADDTPEPSAPGQADVAAIFDERSVLTPQGKLIFEPSLQYVHSTATQVAIDGYTVIPAIAIGLINVSETQRDTLTLGLGFRYGLSRRLDVDLRVPWTYKEESVRERELLQGNNSDLIRDSDGSGLGDIEFGLHYQFNQARNGWPYVIGNLRVKSRTGRDPFEVDRQQLRDKDGVLISEVFAEQPTGSGFWSVQPSLTFLYPSDPAILYGSISYLWNIERDVGGTIGKIDPGDALGFGFGLGFAINDRTSFSLGYDHSIVFETRRENDAGIDATFDRFQVGSFLLGVSHRLSAATNLNLSLGIGVTEQAPDLQLTLKLPMSW